MPFVRLVFRGLLYHWRMNAAVAMGVAAATAVLTGALLVGDSVRGSLRDLTLDRLGTIDELLLTDRFFRQQLVAEMTRDSAFRSHYALAAGIMLFPEGTVEQRGPQGVTRSSNVLIVGSAGRSAEGQWSFWDFDASGVRPTRNPGPGEIVLNQPLADAMKAAVGQRVTVRLPKPENVPADSPLGEKADRISSLPGLEVIEIIPAAGLGRFNPWPSQSAPYNAFVSLEQLQEVLDQPDRVNALLVSGGRRDEPPGAEASQALAAALRPTFQDLGLAVTRLRLVFADPRTGQEDAIYDYFSITADRMILPPEVDSAARRAFGELGGQPVFTYLANTIAKDGGTGQPANENGIPYSMIAAIDSSADFPLGQTAETPFDRLADDEIVLTRWTAEDEDLRAALGDRIRITYYAPETTHGRPVEAHAVLKLRAIVPLTQPSEPYLPRQELRFAARPTLVNDPHLTPVVEGVTDQRSIDNWELPFTIDTDRIRDRDDDYWADYGTTPKAYVSLATGRRLWGSRFGHSTSYRIPARGGVTGELIERQLLEQLAEDGATLGFGFVPIKRRQLDASSGNTPFDVLFLLLSFFIIAAALLLVALLFRLGFEQRSRQAGVLLAVGWRRRAVQRLFAAEGLAVAMLGGVAGIGVGTGYARLILAALTDESWWLGAVTTPFLKFHATATSLCIGYGAGVLVSTGTILWSVSRTRHVPTRRLLAGQCSRDDAVRAGSMAWLLAAALGLVLLAILLAAWAAFLKGQSQAGAFVGAGAAFLAALLLATWMLLRRGGAHVAPITGHLPLVKLAIRSMARNASRSTLTVGLIATASFLIVAMSAFQLRPSTAGTGGFSLVAESSQPVLVDLNNPAGRGELLDDSAGILTGCSIHAFRVRPGDDASCGNLYKAAQPRILGVPDSLVSHFDDPNIPKFEFSDWEGRKGRSQSDPSHANPWRLLGGRAAGQHDGSVAVVIDKETAVYSLGLRGGIGEERTFVYDGRPVRFRVVGLLSLGILHGDLLISERDFLRLFPGTSGYRHFLIATDDDAHAERVSVLLEDALGDLGFDARDATQRLYGLMQIQNTYLRTFQSLGALGLLLGTFGLAAVQWRSVLERRGEMALLRAAGFRRSRLALWVLLENLLLLLGGLLAGTAAALLAVLPHLIAGGAAVPVAELSAMLAIVLAVGIVAGSLAAHATLRVPLLAALREER
ncbi:MAG: ABC transporter permease [Planctomycetes bacterium]|nr:ABC transporter permease [Planctomycetota bacterium]